MNVDLFSTRVRHAESRHSHRCRLPELAGLAGICAAGAWWAVVENYPALIVAVGAISILGAAMPFVPRAILLWLTTSLAVHVIVGMALDGYAWCLFDDVLHFCLVGWLTFLAMKGIGIRTELSSLVLSLPEQLLVGSIFALGVGAAWELFECLIDLTGTYQAQVGLIDTMMDVFAGAIGGISACLFLSCRVDRFTSGM